MHETRKKHGPTEPFFAAWPHAPTEHWWTPPHDPAATATATAGPPPPHRAAAGLPQSQSPPPPAGDRSCDWSGERGRVGEGRTRAGSGDGSRQGGERAAAGGEQSGGAQSDGGGGGNDGDGRHCSLPHSGGGGEEGREGDQACRAMSAGYAALRRAHPHSGVPASRRFSGDGGGRLHLQQV